MSIRDKLRGADRALLKPYAGAGKSGARPYTPVIVAIVVGLLCVPYGFYYALTTPWLLVPFVVPLAILALLVIWAAPAAKTVPMQFMERLFFALFTAIVLWPNYLAISLPGLPWITITRLVSTPLTLFFLTSLSSNRSFRTRISDIIKDNRVFWILFITFAAMQIITIPISAHAGETISKIVVNQTTETMPLFLGCYIFTRPGRPKYLVYTIWIAVLAVSAIGWFEAPIHHPLWTGHIPSFLAVGNDLTARIMAGGVRSTTGQYRVQAVYSTPLGLSEYLALATPFVLDLAISKKSIIAIRLAAAATLPLILVMTLQTDSRFGLIAFFLSVMLYLLGWALVQRRRMRSLLGTAVVLAYPALFAVGVVASMTVGRIRAKVWGTGQYDDSTAARVEQFNLAFPKMMTHPLGHGVGMGAEAIGYHMANGLLSVDSYYLALVMDLGFIGLGSFVIMFLYLVFKSLILIITKYDGDSDISYLMPASISLIVFLFIKLVFAQEDNHPIMFFISGMIVALLYKNSVNERLGSTARAS